MKLLWSSRSPFARKVMVAAYELGIAERIETRRVVVANDVIDEEVIAANPLNQIPTLVSEDGVALFDSTVIIDWLDRRFGPRLLPQEHEERWRALRLQAVGDGLAQQNRARLAEARRGASGSDAYGRAYHRKTAATLDWLEQEAPALAAVSAGSIAVAVALAHLDFRFPWEGWRETRPLLASWHAAFSDRPSMRATEPEDVY